MENKQAKKAIEKIAKKLRNACLNLQEAHAEISDVYNQLNEIYKEE